MTSSGSIPARTLPASVARDPGRRTARRLLLLVVARQLRMGVGLPDSGSGSWFRGVRNARRILKRQRRPFNQQVAATTSCGARIWRPTSRLPRTANPPLMPTTVPADHAGDAGGSRAVADLAMIGGPSTAAPEHGASRHGHVAGSLGTGGGDLAAELGRTRVLVGSSFALERLPVRELGSVPRARTQGAFGASRQSRYRR